MCRRRRGRSRCRSRWGWCTGCDDVARGSATSHRQRGVVAADEGARVHAEVHGVDARIAAGVDERAGAAAGAPDRAPVTDADLVALAGDEQERAHEHGIARAAAAAEGVARLAADFTGATVRVAA